MPFDPKRIQRRYKNRILKTILCRVSSCSKWISSNGEMRRHLRSQHPHRYDKLICYFPSGNPVVVAGERDPVVVMSDSSHSTSSSSSRSSLSPVSVPLSPLPPAKHSHHLYDSHHFSPVGHIVPEMAHSEDRGPGNKPPVPEEPAVSTPGSILVEEDVEEGPWMHDDDNREVDEDAEDMDLPPASVTYHATINGT